MPPPQPFHRTARPPPSSHWMAMLAMDQSAYRRRHLAAGAVLVRSPEAIRTGCLNVLAPSAWLLRADALPDSWDVTSDSIAAWVARALRAARLVLLKSVDGVPGPARPGPARIRAQATRRQLRDVADAPLARALRADLARWTVRG